MAQEPLVGDGVGGEVGQVVDEAALAGADAADEGLALAPGAAQLLKDRLLLALPCLHLPAPGLHLGLVDVEDLVARLKEACDLKERRVMVLYETEMSY